MDFNWVEYLCLAEELLAKPLTGGRIFEAKLRTAISRAYYSAFGTASEFLQEKNGLTVPRKNPHLFVSNQFCASNEKKKKKLGSNLDRLKDLRVKADYYKNWPVDLEKQGTIALTYAHKIISSLRSLNL